jgi:hypothetical protein
MDLDHLRNPQRVALQAKRLGMVPQAAPAFVNLSDGTVLGTPTPATPDDAIRLNPLPTRRPGNLKPKIIKVITPNPAAAVSKKPQIGGAAPQARR